VVDREFDIGVSTRVPSTLTHSRGGVGRWNRRRNGRRIFRGQTYSCLISRFWHDDTGSNGDSYINNKEISWLAIPVTCRWSRPHALPCYFRLGTHLNPWHWPSPHWQGDFPKFPAVDADCFQDCIVEVFTPIRPGHMCSREEHAYGPSSDTNIGLIIDFPSLFACANVLTMCSSDRAGTHGTDSSNHSDNVGSAGWVAYIIMNIFRSASFARMLLHSKTHFRMSEGIKAPYMRPGNTSGNSLPNATRILAGSVLSTDPDPEPCADGAPDMIVKPLPVYLL
jgi:hypothetical protein